MTCESRRTSLKACGSHDNLTHGSSCLLRNRMTEWQKSCLVSIWTTAAAPASMQKYLTGSEIQATSALSSPPPRNESERTSHSAALSLQSLRSEWTDHSADLTVGGACALVWIPARSRWRIFFRVSEWWLSKKNWVPRHWDGFYDVASYAHRKISCPPPMKSNQLNIAFSSIDWLSLTVFTSLFSLLVAGVFQPLLFGVAWGLHFTLLLPCSLWKTFISFSTTICSLVSSLDRDFTSCVSMPHRTAQNLNVVVKNRSWKHVNNLSNMVKRIWHFHMVCVCVCFFLNVSIMMYIKETLFCIYMSTYATSSQIFFPCNQRKNMKIGPFLSGSKHKQTKLKKSHRTRVDKNYGLCFSHRSMETPSNPK